MKYKKVLLIGSGPIVIGQAAEFDYSGAQAAIAMREEGVKVVLANSNPATIQTDLDTADTVYLEPLNKNTLENIIEKEKPDAFVATMAGQTGLNLAVELREALKKNNAQVLGTQVETIELAENREKFAALMKKINEPVPQSAKATTLNEAKNALEKIKLPAIIRADYALGGAGSGIAKTKQEFEETAMRALQSSATHTILIEQSIAGTAEYEYEVVRDAQDNCITICSMENMDPTGVHTGESIVTAPAQTLTDNQHQMLRSAAIKIIRALNVKGACNIQFALNQKTSQYWVIEVNPRVSRSSALASKATGYPIARVAAKIALGYTLPEITNKVTGKTACFEPALDYIVLKIPRWPFDKFGVPNGKLGTQMKSTGETMAIGRTFEEALNKAIRSLEIRSGYANLATKQVEQEKNLEKLLQPSELRLFHIKELLRKGTSIEKIAEVTKINPWFLHKLQNIVTLEEQVKNLRLEDETDQETFTQAKKAGFSDRWISTLCGRSLEGVRFYKEKIGLKPSYKIIDTCAGEFKALTPYYYSSYEQESDEETKKTSNKKVIILGSGPIRIGQGIEFDYSTVHAVTALKEKGFEAIIINNNPETVSTDFDISDKLYFEPLTLEDVLAIIKRENENLQGVIVQFGGQTSINLATGLKENDVNILGTPVESIDAAEDRKQFAQIAKKLSIPLVKSAQVFTRQEALEKAEEVNYPILLRPSFVLGGRAMTVVTNRNELEEKIDEAVLVSEGRPITMDHFLENAIEIDVDLLCDGKNTVIAGVMEQIEEAGAHSGDSACVLPTQTLSQKTLQTIKEYSKKIALKLQVKGLCNLQMAVKD
ncbi:MAG: carbamoyl-phosphate synthase (glutamine-hydrolyzing) large subunit, partial [Candidatus Micrarchaeia archaeon]